MKFTKPPLTFEEQIALLKSRGLAIPDDARALRWLRSVSYYRLSAYFIPFRKPDGTDEFRAGATLHDVLELYKFDARLRVLLIQDIDRIEVSFRTSITYELAHSFGCFSHTDQNTYSQWFLSPKKIGKAAPYVDLMQTFAHEEKKAKEQSVKTYRTKYISESALPVWIATELMSFGTLSMMFSGLKSATRTKIAAIHGLPDEPFTSWIHVLTTIRNFCAHHNRLWNRQLGVRPKIPHGWKYKVPHSDRIYSIAVMAQHLLSVVSPQCRWKQRFITLMESHPSVEITSMGFSGDWRQIPPWK